MESADFFEEYYINIYALLYYYYYYSFLKYQKDTENFITPIILS